ncbi:methyl-accepting chemotaxis protein [Brachyspira pilosicoli]|uniref:Methyl-accepting chemotaxis protein n=3 Tax=Brachyspira TaxID=29521 RepID=A0AAJ6GAM4_BRAPL|nr:methyl-accepting chemotaxis protein [Brachyspira pilosicoli]WIH81995.1 methyl-accepting chemotaxis protein [Brachyspira pilosicoli]WIH83949.1 methyl-accepting chemotaxis protein [Brachyspira pilosicoli]WIH86484.1 methyl-accepting chemotaxis protein [Brachyspira pilosicoli]WIH88454.1 methyl-accepting chemotaxis protein [Brachyspira pilosicoli]WIH90728.1 methyl-accepting chemotaxis protein [Brachyspira pilosicoli]
MKNLLMVKFIAPIIIFLLLLFVAIFIIYKPLYRERFLNERYLELLEAKTRTESYVDELKNTIYVMGAYLESNPSLVEVGNFLTNVQKLDSGYLNLYFGDTVPYSRGGIFINSLEPFPTTYDQTSRDWYRAAVATNDIMISNPYIDYVSKNLTVTFSKAVYTNNSLKGVCAVDFDNINGIAESLKKNYKEEVYIVSENGIFMTHTNDNYILNETNNLFTYKTFANFSGNLLSHVGDLNIVKDEWYSIQKVDNAPWLLVFRGSAKPFYSQFNFLMLSLFLCIVLLIILECLLVAKIVIPLSNNLYRAIDIMKLMKEGKFDNKFNKKDLARKDVAGVLSNSINDMQKLMYEILSKLKTNISLINASSEEISGGIDDLSNRSSSQAAAVEEMTSSIENLFTAISNTSKSSFEAKNMSSKVTESTQHGVDAVNEISHNMMEISESSKEISNITKLIQSIAFQTNILALNAAVEAARAGEQGRGFAVVASEIRALAQNVNEAAGNITNIIEKTVAKIEIGDESVKSSLAILLEIEKSAKEVSDILVNIYEAASEEEDSVRQINVAMNELNEITQENSELANKSSILGKEIVDGANNLSSELEYFKVNTDD